MGTEPRKFIYNNQELPDINPALSIDDIRKHYADFFPELYNAETGTVTKDGVTYHTFKKRVGDKSVATVISTETFIKSMRNVPEKSLMLIELANTIPVVDGVFDSRQLEKQRTKIGLAIQEANIYTNAVARTVSLLQQLPARQV